MKDYPTPNIVFQLWAFGAGDLYCAADKGLPIHPLRRLLWQVRGSIICALTDWWWWDVRPTKG